MYTIMAEETNNYARMDHYIIIVTDDMHALVVGKIWTVPI